MARDGFVVGFAETTSENPALYWNGEAVDESLDDAFLYTSLSAARAQAGTLQTTYIEYHVEAYPCARTIIHTPALPIPTDTGTEGV